jgi:hypothetical protein
MDLSKLPKLSDTQAASGDAPPVPVGAVPPTAPYREPTTPRPAGVGADVWISTVIGLLFIFMGMTFAKFAIAKLSGQPFHTGVEWTDDAHPANTEVSYFELSGYTAWTEMGAFLFGLTLLFEAASKAAVTLKPGTGSRGLLGLAIVLTLATVALNLWACGLLLHVGITPLLSGIAVAFGGWVLYDEWQTLRLTTPITRPAAANG